MAGSISMVHFDETKENNVLFIRENMTIDAKIVGKDCLKNITIGLEL